MRDEGGEGDSRLDGKGANVLLSTGRTDAAKGILGWSSEVVEDLVELINVTEDM